ncbi:exodeoxyribonuclease VII small subunit [Candidatus Poribacteria bacterium]|nr:MAG: exodeoxyribonuclease VII small subunit [Candidatus Poribacteria bacterium]
MTSFEEKLERLNHIVEQLEAGDALTLDASLTLFEEGITLVRGCQQLLETAELRVQNVLEQDTPEPGENDPSRL